MRQSSWAKRSKEFAREIVGVGAGLQRGLLRQAEKKIGEVEAGVGYGLAAAGKKFGSFQSGEDETSLRHFSPSGNFAGCGDSLRQSANYVCRDTRKGVGDGVGLIELAARRWDRRGRRRCVKLMPGRPKSNGSVETPSNAREPRDVYRIRVEVRGADVIVVVVEAQNVGAAAVSVGPAGAGACNPCVLVLPASDGKG